MIDLFDHGVFLDKRNIPIISPKASNQISELEIQQHIQQIFEATIVNKLWNADSVFLYCYPMDESTCKALIRQSSNNRGNLLNYFLVNGYKDKWNEKLQAWVGHGDGYGCYLQG
jgi:hypothetical protein